MAAPVLQNSTAPGIALAHTVYGEHVTSTVRENNTGPNVGPATWSTAPYVPPSARKAYLGSALCAFEGCAAYPARKSGLDLCVGHARSAGLIATCKQDGCNKTAPVGGIFCGKHVDDHSD